MASGGVPEGAQTSNYYRVKEIPDRFENPGLMYNPGNPVFTCQSAPNEKLQSASGDWFQGYGSKPQHAMYRTSNADYGNRKPTVHTVPTQFHAKSQRFSDHLGKTGMFRNHSLNCASDKSNVPDH